MALLYPRIKYNIESLLESLGLVSPYLIRKRNKMRLLNEQLSMTPFFKKYPSDGDLWMVDKCAMISKKNGFLYVRIPKAGNSTVVATLYHAEFGKKEYTREEMNNIKMNGYTRPSELSVKEVENGGQDYFKFTITRDPYSRIKSAYLDKIGDKTQYQHRKPVLRFHKKDMFESISFSEFLEYLKYGKGLRDNYHWTPQAFLMPYSVNKISYVGKLETIGNDLKNITEQIFGKPEPIVTWRPHSTKKKSTSFELTKKHRGKIYNLYEIDFDLFNYARGK